MGIDNSQVLFTEAHYVNEEEEANATVLSYSTSSHAASVRFILTIVPLIKCPSDCRNCVAVDFMNNNHSICSRCLNQNLMIELNCI